MQLPQFNHIMPDKIQLELQEILANNLKMLDTQDLSKPIEILEIVENRLRKFWSPISHLHAVRSEPKLREAYKSCLSLLSDYETKIAHHEKLYQAILNYKPRNPQEKRIVELKLRDFRLSGIALSADKKLRYGEIEKKLSELGAKFSENILDSTQAWSYLASDQELLGIPKEIMPEDKKLTLDYPCYSAIQKYAEDRVLREKCYKAYVTRASELNDLQYDNTTIMNDILILKYELAELLGFKNYAELSLETKMAKSTDQVLDFLNQLVEYAKPAAQKELMELAKFAGHELKPWDTAFYSEKLSQKKHHIHQELFRPYFQASHVLSGLFSLVSTLYSLTIKKIENTEIWDPEVNCFEIYDQHQKRRGIFYVDLYTRKLKRDGAWMDDYCSRYKKPDGELQIPVAYLTCNFMPPQNDQPGLLTHDDVITLFHEFGHGLHHLLTTIDYVDISGINGVPWDAVELPSQFMENFCWEKSILKDISQHYQTGEKLPDELIENLLASRHFNAGLQLLRQLEFGLFDFHLHLRKPQDKNFVLDVYQEIHDKTAVMAAPDYSRFPHTFSHIFNGGYAAAYYSYLWAEVLSCDIFSLFEENGILDADTGKKFLNEMLSQGGSQPPEILFRNFRGRKLDQKAFLKSWGLVS
jgi:oligopeptidase A